MTGSDIFSDIFAAIELSSTAWVVALRLPTNEKISIVRMTAGDVERLLSLLERGRTTAVSAGLGEPKIHTCYEAGYDGFWLHRSLLERASTIRFWIRPASR